MLEKYKEVMEGVKFVTSFPKSSHGTMGLISRPEAEWLYRIPRVLGSGMYAELGTYRGRSACIIGEAIKDTADSFLVTIDMFDDRAVSGPFKHPEMDKYKTVIDLLESRGLSSKVRVVKELTTKAADLFEDSLFNFLFIDADHSYEGVKADFLSWEKKLKLDGLIAFHDSFKKGVFQFLSEITTWEEFDRIESLSVWRRK